MPTPLDEPAVLDDVATPAALSLPSWPLHPDPVDTSGRSFLVVEIGEDARAVADGWATAAAASGPVTRHRVGSLDRGDLAAVLSGLRCGVRIMVVGPQDEVLLALSAARLAGAEPAELRSFVTRTDVLALFCAHCRATSRVVAVPGGTTTCPGCGRTLEVHPHQSAVRGSFLGSDATARELS